MSSLKNMREAARLTQAETAALLGVTQSAVSQWESGGSRPAVDKIVPIAALYKTTAEAIVTAVSRAGKRSA